MKQDGRTAERYSKQLASLISMSNVYVLLLLSTKLFHQNKNTRYFDLENKVRCFSDILQPQFTLPNVNHLCEACKLVGLVTSDSLQCRRRKTGTFSGWQRDLVAPQKQREPWWLGYNASASVVQLKLAGTSAGSGTTSYLLVSKTNQ